MARSLRLLALGAVLAGVLAAGGCGANSETGQQEGATTEGSYMELGGLKYQVQISRILIPRDIEDQGYLKGLPEGVTTGPGDVWFGVFMRVENDGEKPLTPQPDASYAIRDTQDDSFSPVPLDTKVNVFAYQPLRLQPGDVLPRPDSAAGEGVIQGGLVLFKLKVDDLQNRPLTLRISEGQSGPSASVQLDL